MSNDDLEPRRETFGDLRDDYDDDFGRGRAPLEQARRQLAILGIVYVVLGVLGVAWTLLFASVYVVEYQDADCELDEFALAEGIVTAVLLLFVVMIAGADAMIRFRRRWLAMSAAFIMAAFSVPLFLLGVWALLLLNRPEVREAFAPRPVQSQHDH